MLPPAGLSPEEMRQHALEAGAEDLVRPGWGFAGGSNTFEVGTPVTFLIDLAPGTYAVVCYILDPETGLPHVLDGIATVFTVA